MGVRLGVFDSGLGGLTVVKALRKIHPSVDIIYLGDTARVPYGGRSADTIIRYALECSHFLKSGNSSENKLDAIIVACNTVSALALPALREQNEVPIYGVITPGAKAASKYDRVGLLATKATVESRAYETEIAKFSSTTKVISVASPLLVPLVEEGWTIGDDRAEVLADVVGHYLKPLVKAQVQAIILGCTHYPILKPIIESELTKLNWNVALIDSGEELARELDLSQFKNQSPSSSLGEFKIFTTDESPRFQKIAESYLLGTLPQILKAEL